MAITITATYTTTQTITMSIIMITTVYERVTDRGMAISIAVILLIMGIAIDYLVKRKINRLRTSTVELHLF
jgi:hypothetical protein